MSRSAIAEWLQGARQKAGKTQREAANHLDIDSQTVSNWETGRHPITAEDFFKLVAFYEAAADLVMLLALGAPGQRATVTAPPVDDPPRAHADNPPRPHAPQAHFQVAKPPLQQKKRGA